MENNLKPLIKRLGHDFKDPGLLKQALTHCSYAQANNERLEFLGDAILSYVIAHALYQRFPEETEGRLSRLRSFLVKGERLAEIAFELKLGDFLFLGQGELKSGGFRRASILADALEAVIAAVFLDGGIEPAKALILKLYDSRLSDKKILQHNIKDHKTLLQEFLQSRKLTLPVYQLTQLEGEEHDQVFHVSCRVAGTKTVTEGKGQTRRKAEQQAAKLLLDILSKAQ